MKNKKLSPLKKAFIRSLFYVLSCFLIILLFINSDLIFVIISLGAFCLGMWHLILLFAYSSFLIDEIWPPKYPITSELPMKIKKQSYFILALFFLTIVVMIFEIPMIDNTIRGTTLVWQFALIGLVIAVGLILKLKTQGSLLFQYSETRIGVYIVPLLSLLLLFPGLASLLNHGFPKNEGRWIESRVIKKHGINSNDGYVTTSNDILLNERLDPPKNFFKKIKEGDIILLQIKTGALGYTFVEEFKLKK